MFDIHPTNASPIWLQIEEGVRRMITLGSLVPGDVVPSVRDLAKTLRVNPNTVARAYQRLTDAGVLTTGAAFPATVHVRLARVTTDATRVTAGARAAGAA